MVSFLHRAFSRLGKFEARSPEKVLFKGRSKYRMLTVVENKRSHTRIMYASNRLFVAGIDTKTGFPLYSPYFLADIFVQNPGSALFLGGGPNAVPAYVWKKYRPKLIHVVEHDSLTTKLAEKYFGLPQDKNYKIFHTDAKTFLLKTSNKYDIIYFNIGLTRRRGFNKKDLYQLCNLSGILNLSKHLSKNGVLIYVLIGKLRGKDYLFIRRRLTLFRKIFPTLCVFSDFQKRPSKTQTVVFVATKSKRSLQKEFKKFIGSHLRMHPKEIYEDLMTKLISKPWELS